MEDFNTNFNFTKPAIMIPTVSGSISFLSSMLIIYVILKSPKLVFSTPYHRIMFGMSIGDCIVSLAIALTTIPMPRDVIYPFAQSSYGNIHTCNAQAYASIGGQGATFWMSVVLYIYYGCSLVFHVKDVTFRKWIETPMVTFFILLLFSPLLYLHNVESLNPSPSIVWCTRKAYPYQCTKDIDPDCREGGRGDFTAVWITVTLATFAFLIIDMCLIVFSFYRAERKLKELKEEHDNSVVVADGDAFTDHELLETRTDKRRITKEALMYIASFFATWIFPVIYADLVEDQDGFKDIPVLAALRLFFQPLQGFLNMLIFFYHKMEILKGKDENQSLSMRARFKLVVLHPGEAFEEKRMVISNLPMLEVSSISNSDSTRKKQASLKSVEDPPSQNLNLYLDVESSQEASKGGFHLSQGESLASSFQQSEVRFYDEIRRQISNGDYSSSSKSGEQHDLSFRLHSVAEETCLDDLS
ncbi:hypothetical protein CTEN210_02801 [Chaetoceros tenuissimus]|uniref:G-protein coupled receptors family 1 profile domain-containing protein n=1 Tax=Chaetoceros tenuissimus TaxID=426638 RepID=A0AAD3CHR3_9STRA|nr:hypothetical protein CTEN210_02801 [Chaetoceros tenuissimus]